MSRRLIFPVALTALTLGVAAIAAAQERLARLNVEETHLSAEQAHNMNQLSRLLSVLQQLRRDPPPALLVSPRDAKDAVRAAILVKAMTPELERRAIAYSHQANEMMRLRRLAAVESEALFTNDSRRADASPLPARAPQLRGPAAPGVPDAAITPPQSLTTPISGPIVRRFGDTLSSGGRANETAGATALKVDEVKLSPAQQLENRPSQPNAKQVATERRAEAKAKGYEGDACGECQNYTLVRNGTCMKCDTCGSTTGCS